MIVLKSLIAGVVAAVAAAVLYVAGSVAWLIAQGLWRSRAGSGGIGAVSVGFADVPVLAIVLAGFAAGFIWQFRRASRAR
jgi:hypothetical protein